MFGSASPIESYMHIRILAPPSTFNKSSTGYVLGDKNRQYVIPLVLQKQRRVNSRMFTSSIQLPSGARVGN